MSRVGKKPVTVPKGVDVQLGPAVVTVKGPKGSVTAPILAGISAEKKDGTVVLTSEPKAGGKRWRYTYRNIRPDGVDADYASRSGKDGAWTTVWSGRFDRIGPAEK